MYSKNHFDYLKDNFTSFQKLSNSEKFSIYKLIMYSISSPLAKHFNNKNTVSLKSKEMQSAFTKSKRRYKEIVPLFFDEVNQDYRYDLTDNIEYGYTKEFQLNSELKKLLNNFDSYSETKLLNQNGKNMKILPIHSVLSKDINGIDKSSGVNLKSNYVKINAEALDKLINFVMHIIKSENSNLYNEVLIPKHYKSLNEIKDILIYLKSLKAVSINNLYSQPGLIVTYKEGKTGRLFATSLFNPQNMHSEIRKVIFSNMNYYDYDISNCNYSLLYQMYFNYKNIVMQKNKDKRKNNINSRAYYYPIYNTLYKIPESTLPTVYRYLNTKYLFRNELAEQLNIDMNTVKTILLALVMGAKLPTIPRKNSAIWRLINYDADVYLKLLNNSALKNLRDEIKIASDFTIKHSEIFNNAGTIYIKNFADKNMKVKHTKKSEKMAHILQGLESAILGLISSLTDSITVLIFDGFITEERITNLYELTRNIENYFMMNGFPVRIELAENELNFDLNKLNVYQVKTA